MNFFSRFFKREKALPDCPRCLGKGHVDKADIIRLEQVGYWVPGTCAYCKGTGEVAEEMLAKVPANATYLTMDLSDAEREAVIQENSWGSTFPLHEKRKGSPVTEQNRLWLEEGFLMLLDFFGKENTQQRQVLLPDYATFPIQYNGTELSAIDSLKIVAVQMEVPFELIQLGFYGRFVHEEVKDKYFPPQEVAPNTAGLYTGKNEDGKYEIWLNRKQLADPENLVATLAHEIAHIKLLGENRMEENNEYLTDLTTVIFGLGVFNANEAFRSHRGRNYYAYQTQGYLSQVQWGYSLALFAYLRGEKGPAWVNRLTPNIKRDFAQAMRFIDDNPDIIFQ